MSRYEERSAARRARLEAALERFVTVARRYDDVRAVYVFGSLARGAVGPTSDLDLLVVRETALRGPRRGEDLAMDALLGIEYDLIVVTPDEFAARPSQSSFWFDVIANARLCYAA